MKKIFLLIFSFLLSIYFIELILSIKTIDQIIHLKKNLYCEDVNDCDERTSFELYEESIKKNDLILPNFTPVYRFQNKDFDDYKTNEGKKIFPLSKMANQKIAMCNENGKWVIYNTDYKGLNNSHENYDNAEIFILGDSYVEGHCSRPENNIAGQLESKKNIKVVNLGLAGSGPLMMLASAKEYALKFNPKIIIWYHFHNDIINLQRYEKNNKTLMKYLDNKNFDQNLIKRQIEINEVANKYIYTQIKNYTKLKNHDGIFTKYFNKMTFLKLWYTRSLLKKFGINTISLSTKYIQPTNNDLDLFEKILFEVKRITDENNIKLYFVFLPDITGLYPEEFKHYEEIDSREKVIESAKNIFGENTLDLTNLLLKNFKEPKELFHGGILGNHYTDKGYSFVASQTIKLINK